MLFVQLCVVSSLTGMHPVPVLYVECLFISSLCFLACFIGPCRLKHILCSETIRTKGMHSQAGRQQHAGVTALYTTYNTVLETGNVE